MPRLIALLLWSSTIWAQYQEKDSYLKLYSTLGFGSQWHGGNGPGTALNDIYGPGLTWGFGLSWQHEFGKRSMLGLGLNYYRLGEIQREEPTFTFPDNIDPYYGFVHETSPSTSGHSWGRLARAADYISLPINWQYFLSRDRKAWYGELGVMPVYFIGQSSWMKYEDGSRSNRSYFRSSDKFRWQIQALGKIGYRWEMTKSWSIDAAIQAQHSLTYIPAFEGSGYYHWQVGVELGILRKI